MKFLTVRASLQNSCNVGVLLGGVPAPKEDFKNVGVQSQKETRKILTMVSHSLPVRLGTYSYNYYLCPSTWVFSKPQCHLPFRPLRGTGSSQFSCWALASFSTETIRQIELEENPSQA